eukprot:257115-Alexandrium_andersonii.AAC.1
MSASLVGSEMCIRDRAKTTGILVPIPNLAKATGIEGVRSRSIANSRAPIPVSYTHLTLPTICSV